LSAASLQERTGLIEEYCKTKKVEAHDLAHTLASCRDHERYRAFAVTSDDGITLDFGSFQRGTTPAETHNSVIFVFTGQGSHWSGMGKELFETFPDFRADIRRLDTVLQLLPKPPSWTLEGMFRIV
jgi:acyl transferase domain-containing protein